MAEDVMLQEAIEAIRQGQRSRARDLLTRLLRANQQNSIYWLWMSSVVETSKEQVYCLQSVLRLDPKNQAARQGLVLHGALPPGDAIMPVPPVWRQWPVDLQEVIEIGRVRRLLGNPVVRIILISITALALLGVAGWFIFNWTGQKRIQQIAIVPTRTTPPPVTFTATPTPINFTPTPPTPTPTFEGNIPPLWLRLEKTFTPTPMYVATTHITNEAFNLGIRLYEDGEYEQALERMEQATRFEPDAADIRFHIGEIYMAMEEYQLAYGAYQQAIDVNPDFAPAYLGRARARLAADPESTVINDLDKAIELDPDLIEAYRLRIDYNLVNGDTEAALEDMNLFDELLPNSALSALYRAQILISEGEAEEGLEMAEKANELDPSLLFSYLVLGEAAVLNEDYDTALEALDVYRLYAEDDAQTLVLYGQVLFATEQYSDTLEVMQSALDLDKDLAEAYYYRGLVFIENDEGQKAVNEIVLARNLDRSSFDYSLALGRALLSANRLAEARDQITAAGRLADSDEELAQMYYYRALTIEEIGNQPSADKDWQALLELPSEAVPRAWLRLAHARLATPTPSQTPTPTGTLTPSGTLSPIGTRTPKPTQS